VTFGAKYKSWLEQSKLPTRQHVYYVVALIKGQTQMVLSNWHFIKRQHATNNDAVIQMAGFRRSRDYAVIAGWFYTK
jgi:hypothetical protein